MAVLIVQIGDRFAAGAFDKLALIGRKPFNGVQLEHRTVSRIHAWVEKTDQGYCLHNASNRNGTYLNGQKVIDGELLRDGDHIQLGLAKLVYREADEIPEGAMSFAISEKGTNPDYQDDGILFRCQCGAPVWVPQTMAGAYGKCVHCRGDITVPGDPMGGVRRPLTPNDSIVDEPALATVGNTEPPADPLAAVAEKAPRQRPPSTAKPRPKAPPARQICSVCQSPIMPLDPVTVCSACTQTYHSECWISNHGCAAYGCSQVGILDPHPAPEPVPPAAASSPPSASRVPWEFALLGAGIIACVIGAFTFGAPPFLVGFAGAIYAFRQRGRRAVVASLSVVICMIGLALGIMTSRFWWLHVPLWTW